MTDVNTNNLLEMLKISLIQLSKPYEDQVKYFPRYVDVVDEVVGDFDNAFRILPLIMEKKPFLMILLQKLSHAT